MTEQTQQQLLSELEKLLEEARVDRCNSNIRDNKRHSEGEMYAYDKCISIIRNTSVNRSSSEPKIK